MVSEHDFAEIKTKLEETEKQEKFFKYTKHLKHLFRILHIHIASDPIQYTIQKWRQKSIQGQTSLTYKKSNDKLDVFNFRFSSNAISKKKVSPVTYKT